MPHVLLGKLPLVAGREVQILACKEPDNGLMEQIRESTFPEMASTCHQLKLQNDDYVLDVAGFLGPNSAFMVSVLVTFTPRA